MKTLKSNFYKKNGLFILLLSSMFFCFEETYSQENKENTHDMENKKKVHFRINTTFELRALKDSVFQSARTSSNAFLFKFSGGISFLRYCFIDAGFGVAFLKDEDKDTIAVTGGHLGNFSNNATTKVTSGEFFYKAGVKIPIVSKLHSEISFGQSYFNATRKVTNCEDCPEESLDIKGREFIIGKLSYDIDKYFSCWCAYTKFFKRSSFKYSPLIGFSMEF